jgi:hypothetical protein
MPETADPYEQAERELVWEGRPRPKGDAWLKSIRDALIALAAVTNEFLCMLAMITQNSGLILRRPTKGQAT